MGKFPPERKPYSMPTAMNETQEAVTGEVEDKAQATRRPRTRTLWFSFARFFTGSRQCNVVPRIWLDAAFCHSDVYAVSNHQGIESSTAW